MKMEMETDLNGPVELCNDMEELEQIERSRFLLELAKSALQETKACYGCCGALKALTSETLANDQEIQESRRWEALDQATYFKELRRAYKVSSKPTSQGWRKKWMKPSPRSRFPGKVHFRRLLKRPANSVHSFREESRRSSERILRQIRGKPAFAAEIQYKLEKEQDDKILHFLDDFLEFDEVKTSGVNRSNVDQHLNFVGLLMVLNLASTSSPLRIVANPAQKSKAGFRNNDNVSPGEAYIERIRSVFLRMRICPVICLGDISNFYLRIKIDVLGTLSGAVWLQRDENGRAVLNPNIDAPLEVAVFVASRFGQVDAGTLAALARNFAVDAYIAYYPDNEDKLPTNLVEEVRSILNRAYVDDVLHSVTAKSMEENNEPLSPTGYVGQLGSERFELLAMVITRVLEFVGFTIKKFVLPPDRDLQAKLNSNPLLSCNLPESKSANRPLAKDVHREGVKREHRTQEPVKDQEVPAPADHLLGIAWMENDHLGLRRKRLNVGKARGGVRPKETEIKDPEAFDKFVARHGSLTRRQLISLISQAFNPLGDLAGIYHLASRVLARDVMLESDHVLKWEEKVNPKWNDKTRELVKLFYYLQVFSIKRYAILPAFPRDIKIYLYCLTDGSPQAAVALTYVVSVPKSRDTKVPDGEANEVHLIRCSLSTSTLGGRTAAANECKAGEMGASSLVEVARHFISEGFEIEEIAIITDANYLLDLARGLPGRLKPPFNGYLGRMQLSIAVLSEMDEIVKTPSLFSSFFYIDQQMKIKVGNKMVETLNYADLCSKVPENETAERMMDKWETIHYAEWMRSKRSLWIHISNSAKRLARKKQRGECHPATLPQFRDKDVPDNSIESFQTAVESISEDPQEPPVVVVPDDLSGRTSKVHLFDKFHSYDLTKPTPRSIPRDNVLSENILRFTGRFHPLSCAQRVAGAVMFARRKFKSCLTKRLIGSYDDSRDESAEAGMWLLTAESAERLGPHLIKLRPILKDMEVVVVNFHSFEVPVALGRQMRKNLGRWESRNKLPPQYFTLRLIKKGSPLMKIIMQDIHKRGHNIGPNTLMKTCVREGFLWRGCEGTFQKQNESCAWCILKRATFRKLVQEQAILGPDSTLQHLTSEDILDVVVMDETGPYNLDSGAGKFHLLMCVELTTRRVHIIPIETMSIHAIIQGLQILSSRRGAWKIIIADHATAHESMSSESTMIDYQEGRAPSDLQGFMKKRRVQEAAESMGMRFKLVSAKSHYSVGLAEDVSKRLKHLFYDTFKKKCKNVFEAFNRAAALEEQINDRIIAVCPDGSILTPNSFAYSAGLHSNMSGRDIVGMSSSPKPNIVADLAASRKQTAATLLAYSNHYAQHLLTFTARKFKVSSIGKGDIVVVLDRVKKKFYDPDSFAIGRVLEVSQGQRQFMVEMVGPSPRLPPLERRNQSEKPLSRPRSSLVLLLRANENLDAPVWVDPWMNLSQEDVVNAKYNPMKVKFKTNFPKVPPNPANLPGPVDVRNQRVQGPVGARLQPKSLTIQHGEPLDEIQDIQDIQQRPVQNARSKPQDLTIQPDKPVADAVAEVQASHHSESKHDEMRPPKPALRPVMNMSAIKLPDDWKDKSLDELELELKGKKMVEPPALGLEVQHEEAVDTTPDLPRVVETSAPAPPSQTKSVGNQRTLRPRNATRRSPRF